MSDNSASIASNVWNYAHVLKNAGVGYGDLRRDATNTACGGTPQPLSEEAIGLVLKQAAVFAPVASKQAKWIRRDLPNGGFALARSKMRSENTARC